MNFNFTHLQTLFDKHPISFKSIRNVIFFFAACATLLALLALHNVYTQQIIVLIEENRAPKSFEFLCSIALIYLSFRVAAYGPIQNLKSPDVKLFGVYFPNVALNMGAAYVGVAWGVATAAFLSAQSLPPPLTYGTIFLYCFKLSAGLLLIYAFFVLITVNERTAPGYQTRHFHSTMRWLAGLFCFFLVGRSILLLIHLFMSVE